MFKNLIDFGYKRSALQALGFYLAYFFLLLMIISLVGAVMGLFGYGFMEGLKMGALFAIVISILLSILIVTAKNLLNFMYIFLIIVAGMLAFLGGALLGLIIPAYLTTK
ncbi:hypothetical protein A2526_05590 [candidate division WOR-1 bacterium RIFOXYD2_FULL_36_8]|uniref:Uncharacterized protein n=1 Tax=candidate division WOR-1 bacterium RIFOXYB2_FULL_36_35 TaxID=1802578 RepID=A0A1F4RY97_UNCSA|nr:MAG: hypothetical protein A2230_04190 [candidate division WOR-1 bacterium RIFOXYA2_FULL_36_21]OGC13144.1 MAG: hypothetical protein A2290_07535 [candidate division WOR-1 bacterium RIFOXYB2_FULL_36_35]OGC16916.1 MAG: hypothetical protein A2282_05690 [candidate division WOR-1 bacterium RIFOXYA12_FULL_36_13]OGC40522.1 MAG: hypothetical protein A2526_05590 [candidate division WOR-1 bacterium RIFOXYD2_FULL_36_8]